MDAAETNQHGLDWEENTLHLFAISGKLCLGEYIYYDIIALWSQTNSSK